MQRNARTIRAIAPWLVGMLTASLFFALLYAYSSFQYIGSDDAPILRSFMGYEGGEPANFHLYIHTALAWTLYALARLMPGVAWFSIVQLFLLWFAQVVMIKSLAQLTSRRGLSLWAGALLGILFLAGYAVYITCRISYTTTSALLGAAAVAQLASVDMTQTRRGKILRPLLGSAVLLLQCYFLRQVSVLPPLCFWVLMLLTKVFIAFGKGKLPLRQAKPVLIGVLVTALAFGGLAALREADIALTGTRPLLAWQQERIQLLDYSDFDHTTTPETLQAIGWSDNEFTLFTYWYFMDDNMSLEALQTLNAQQAADDAHLTIGDKLLAMLTTVRNSLRANPAITQGIYAALALALAALFAAACRRESSRWAYLGTVLAALGGALLLGYLGYSGRLPMRAAASVLFPFAAFAASALAGALSGTPPIRIARAGAHIPAAAPEPTAQTATIAAPLPCDAPAQVASSAPEPPVKPTPQPRILRPLWAIPLILALCASLWFAMQAAQIMAAAITPPADEEEMDYSSVNMADLDAYALENPDILFIHDLSQLGDTRLFPHTPADLAGNVLFWGGYTVRTPSWYRTLEKYGLSELNGSIFLRENVLLASTDPEPWPSLMAYIAESTDQPLEWAYETSIGYVNIFRIYTY